MAALTLKRRLPRLDVSVVRSPDLSIIGVGEGTTLHSWGWSPWVLDGDVELGIAR